MDKWDYTTIELVRAELFAQDGWNVVMAELTTLGQLGWELVGEVTLSPTQAAAGSGPEARLILKRRAGAVTERRAGR